MLALAVDLLTGRYTATEYNNRSRAEWPPHPARLFSALVDALYAQQPLREDERDALLWLEAQGAPLISASEAAERESHAVFVPVNDISVLNDADLAVDRAAEALRDAEANPTDGGRVTVRDARKKLESAKKNALKRTIADGSPSKADLASAVALLPERRGRQPRGFPSCRPDDAIVVFSWPAAEPTEPVREALDRVAERVVRLGHSSSLVSVRVTDKAPTPRWFPSSDGDLRLRVFRHGQLAALDAAFDQHRATEPRVLPAAFQLYGGPRRADEAECAVPFLGDDWLVLRRTGGPVLPATAGVGVAKALRRALLANGPQPPPPVLSGHGEDGRPLDRPHLALLPLPFVGHAHADGSLLGVAIALPRDSPASEREAVFRAVARWEASLRRDDEETPALPILLGRAGVLSLMRLEDVAEQRTLRATSWCAPSRVWLTATPIALDRNPGELRSRDPGTERAAIAAAAEAIATACERIGLPRPSSVEVLPAAPLTGAAKARHYPRYPDEPNRTQRVLTHARLEFADRVRGPVCLGAGRYLGLGLCRPLREES